jgi:hypothetical protein
MDIKLPDGRLGFTLRNSACGKSFVGELANKPDRPGRKRWPLPNGVSDYTGWRNRAPMAKNIGQKLVGSVLPEIIGARGESLAILSNDAVNMKAIPSDFPALALASAHGSEAGLPKSIGLNLDGGLQDRSQSAIV